MAKLIALWAVPALASVLMGLLTVVLLARYFVLPFRADVLPRLAGPPPAKRRARKRAPVRDVLISVGAAFLLSRSLILLVAAIATRGEALRSAELWSRWDASHYLGLARSWYVNEGDARLHLVFFPLYPLILRGFVALGIDAFAAGVLVSNACLFGAGWALYRLVELDGGAQSAARAVLLMMLTPLSFFFSIPYSESLFLLLTLVSVLMARRRRFAPAIALAALASSARLLGLLAAVPIFYEMLLVVREKKGGELKRALICALRCLPVALGFLAYLYLNFSVSGDPLRFLTYQREHWSQQMGSLSGTLRYTLSNAIHYRDATLQWGTWIPQLLSILASIGMLTATYRKLNAGDAAYALLYIYLAISPTWLLSGPRYLTAMYPLYPMLTALTEDKRAEASVMALSVVATCGMVYQYLVWGGVM